MVTIQELKEYLRVTTLDPEEERVILSLEPSAKDLVLAAARVDADSEEGAALINEHTELFKSAVKYATAYLYEHRESADHNALAKDLRSILFPVREARF